MSGRIPGLDGSYRRDDDPDDELDDHAGERRASYGPGTPFGTAEAYRIGLDHNTVEGAQLAFFSHLRADKRWHKVVAWIALGVFGLPVLLSLVRFVDIVGSFLWELPSP